MAGHEQQTLVYTDAASGQLKVRRWTVRVVSGPDAGRGVALERGTLLVGGSESNDLIISDPRVSRAHLELRLLEDGLEVRDLGSRNGTYQGTSRIRESVLQGTALLRVGDTELAVEPADEQVLVDTETECLGSMVGTAPAMRRLFGTVCSIAPTDVSVLIGGETGTGKELVAHEIHARSERRDGPMVVVDCGALPEGLVESELFGHRRGAFTGALSDRQGAFALADGGTIFLDEIGEMQVDLQPKLLRVLEQRQIRPVGDNQVRNVNVRVLAATSRDLSEEVKRGRFRSDLFYRLAVVRLQIPALRERLEDLPLLVKMIAEEAAGHEIAVPTGVLDQLAAHHWPGNVRELRNVVCHAVALRPESSTLLLPQVLGINGATEAVQTPLIRYASMEGEASGVARFGSDYREAKKQAVEDFEVRYLQGLLGKHKWNIASAAREAGVDRNYLYRLMKRHDIRRPA